MTKQRPRILLVDDDPQLLQALKRLHGRKYDITTVTEPIKAIQLVNQDKGFAVVVCDYQMPGLKGASCLAKIQSLAPATVRVLLTGNNDLDTAVDAINRGAIFRFLQKPCDDQTFTRCIEDAVRQHELLLGERHLLENTVRGSVQLLSEVLSLTNPAAFGRAVRVQHYVHELLARRTYVDAWEIETAAMLFEIGLVAVPQDVLENHAQGIELTTEQRAILGRHPTIGSELLVNVPRMEGVARIVRYQTKHFDGSGMPTDEVAGSDIPLGARILAAVIAFESRMVRGQDPGEALGEMASEDGRFDPNVLQQLAEIEPLHAQMRTRIVSVRQLVSGYVLDQDIVHSCGSLIVPKGHRITESMIARLRSYADLGHIDREVSVLVDADPATAPVG
jgi:response regulator RpfG family c-di-GMP phosphodiesterase